MKLKEIFNQLFEGKQVGILYHYTSISAVLKILESGKMLDRDYNRGYISFTRNGSGIIGHGMHYARIVIDGNKLANKYKIVPDSQAISGGERGPIKSPNKKQAEERIYQKEVNISNCIIQVDIIQSYANDDLSSWEKDAIEEKTKLNLVDKFLPYR